MHTRPSRTDIVIVGGGLAGLAAGRRLAQAGLLVRIVEARDRLGGRAHTIDLGHGVRVDEGCSYVHGLFCNPLRPIFEKLGVRLVPNGAEDTGHLYQRGKEMDEERAGRIAGAAMGAFFVSTREANVNDPMPAEGSSIADGIEHAFDELEPGDAEAARMVAKSMAGWTGADLDQVALRWWGFEQDHVGVDAIPEGGYSQLVHWLRSEFEDAGGLIELGDPVKRISKDGDQGVTIATASDASYAADYAISTLPLGVMQAGDVTFDPPLPPRKLESLKKLGFGLLNKVMLVYDQPFWTQDGRSAHVIVPDSVKPGSTLLPETAPSAMFIVAHATQPELCLFVGGSNGDALERMSDAEASSWAHNLLSATLGAGDVKRPIKSHVTRWRADAFSRGSYAYIPASTHATPLDMIELSRAVYDDRLFFAGEATEHDLYASAHGAYATGEREAKRILAIIEEKAAQG